VLLSKSGYTNSELALIYLDYLILYTGAAANKPPKVLLMDRHRSHIQDDFVIKAIDYNIHPYPFPRHLTHILQPLNVSVFKCY
jgi:DDE superfamily endonuclease